MHAFFKTNPTIKLKSCVVLYVKQNKKKVDEKSITYQYTHIKIATVKGNKAQISFSQIVGESIN